MGSLTTVDLLMKKKVKNVFGEKWADLNYLVHVDQSYRAFPNQFFLKLPKQLPRPKNAKTYTYKISKFSKISFLGGYFIFSKITMSFLKELN
jgi:hypothetical protein